jgi:hypothetical protein
LIGSPVGVPLVDAEVVADAVSGVDSVDAAVVSAGALAVVSLAEAGVVSATAVVVVAA